MAVTETFPPSPFTTALVDSDEDPTTRISDGGSSVEFSDDTPRPTSGLLHSWRWHWATALNLWSTENEHPTDDDVSSNHCGTSLSHPAGLTVDGMNKDECNGPPFPHLHANGMVDPRNFCPSQTYDSTEEIPLEDNDKAATEKLNCFQANQINSTDNTLQSFDVVNRDSNFMPSNDRDAGIRDQTSVEDKVDQKLGLVPKGPFPKGGVAEIVKVYARRKEGAMEKYKAQTSSDPTSCAIREATKPSKVDLGDDSIAHTVVDAQLQPNTATLDTYLFQPQLNSSLSNNPNKKCEENQEEAFWDVARDLGLTFDDNSGNIVKLKNVSKQADTPTALQPVKGKDQLDP